MGLRVGLVVAVVLAAALSFAATGSGRPTTVKVFTPESIGVNGHLVWLSGSDASRELAPLQAAGIRWLREELPWRVVEPARGTFDWRQTDGLMAAAASRDVSVLGILGYSAPWASSDPSGRGDDKYPPRSVADYARYAAAVAARYGRGGSFWAGRRDLPVRPLKAVELWNEPFGYWFWKPNPDPAAYAALARAAAVAIHAVDPSIQVVASGDLLQTRTDGAIRDWLGAVLDADPGLGKLVDGFGVHPYPSPRTAGAYDDSSPRWSYGRVGLSRQVALAHGANQPFWITEIGWSTANTPDSVTEAAQAANIRDAVVRAERDWGSFVAHIFVYTWDRSGSNTGDREANYGLRRADGTSKPAWDTLKALVSRLARRSVLTRP